MKVSDVMTRGVQTITAQQSIHEAAAMMARIDCGALMVNDQERLIGMITDRDITVRAVAEGRTADTLVAEVMTPDVRYCYEDETLEEVARSMAQSQVRRLPVMSRDERLVGVVSLGNIASSHNPDASSTVLQGVAKGH